MPMSVSHKQRETQACRNSSHLTLPRSMVAVLHHIHYDREFDFFHFFNIQETLILLNHSGIQELSTENSSNNNNSNTNNNIIYFTQRKGTGLFVFWACCEEWETSPLCTNHKQKCFNRIVIVCVSIVKSPRHIVHKKNINVLLGNIWVDFKHSFAFSYNVCQCSRIMSCLFQGFTVLLILFLSFLFAAPALTPSFVPWWTEINIKEYYPYAKG